MALKINNSNYQTFLQKEKFLIIDEDFLDKNKSIINDEIEILEIENKNIILHISNITSVNLKIEISKCAFYGMFLEKVILKDLKIQSLEISSINENQFKTFKTYIDESILDSIWAFDCSFYNGFLIRNNSNVKSVRFNECKIDYSLSFINSKASTLETESSKIDEINFSKIDYPPNQIETSIDNINIFRCDILKRLNIWEVKFKDLTIHKSKIHKSIGLSDFSENVHISVPNTYFESERIQISESTIEKRIFLHLVKLKEFVSYDSTFLSTQFNFLELENFTFENNQNQDYFYWGNQNYLKTISKFRLNGSTISGSFNLSNITLKEELQIKGSSFNSYPSFFKNNEFLEDCKIDFEFTNLTNFVFQKIDFKNVDFKKIDISNADFKDCNWENDFYFKRLKVKDEKKIKLNLNELLEVKNIYSKLKSKFQQYNDYLSSGKFYISEQEMKMKISLKNRTYFEFILLSIHKRISVFGENLTKPIIWLFVLVFLSSIIYLFTGFYSGNNLVNYKLSLNLDNTNETINDWLKSLILSIKNIVPFSVGDNFFINTKESLKLSQLFELFQKILSLILIASFTESFIRYLKK